MPRTTPNIKSLLGLPKTATRRQVNKAYKKAALANHPDHGGSNETMAPLNAAKSIYDNNGGTANVESDDAGDSDGDYVEDDDNDILSDSESASSSNTGISICSSDDGECAFVYDYGDLEETGGSYMVVIENDVEINLEEHEETCGCDLDDEDGVHFLASGGDDDDDADSGVGDMEEADEDIKGEDLGGEEVDIVDEGFVEGDEQD